MFRSAVRRCGLWPAWPMVSCLSKGDELTEADRKTLMGDGPILTPEERIKAIFYVDEFHQISYELNYILQSAIVSGFVGGIYGGVMKSRTALSNYLDRNQATAFTNTFEAKRKLQDQVTLALGRGAFSVGWRLCLFTTTFTSITTFMSVYRGEASMLDYVVGGTVTGAMYQANIGMRGVIVGGGLGCILGSIVGIITMSLLSVTGTTMDDIRLWQYKYRASRHKYMDQAMGNAAKERKVAFADQHDKNVAARLEQTKS